MAKTIDHMDLYVSIAPYKDGAASDQTFDSLRVYVSYRKGRGFEVGYHPGWGDGAMWGCLFDFSKNPLTAGASVLAKEAAKNSVKELQQMYDNLNAGTARKIIAFLFDQRKWEVLNMSLKHIALNSAWATEELLASLTKGEKNTDPTPDPSPTGAGSGCADEKPEESPMMKQFRDLKSKHPDALLLFRCGDFYETYCEDAKECATILGITLTWRTPSKRHAPGDYSDAMAGFPHHALDTYLPKLIRAGKRVAICDQLDPPPTPRVKRGVTETINNNNSNNNQKSETMEAKTMKAADLIGKTIKVKDSANYYVVKSADGETLQTEMHMGERVMPCPMPMTLLNTMLEAGKYVIGEDAVAEVKVTDPTPAPPLDGRGAATASEPTADDPNGEPDHEAVGEIVDKPTAQEPVAQTVTIQPTTKPITKSTTKAKNDGAAAPRPSKGRGRGGVTPAAKLTYSTYQNAKGKTCAKIVGFCEGDAMLERGNAERIHASSTYERDKKGAKVYMLIFGPRYAAAAKDVCRAMNQGKTLDDCQAIIDAATEERVQRREEWKAKRAAYLAGKDDNGAQATGAQAEVKQGYSDADVAAMLRKIMAGGAIPEDIKKAMAA